MASYVKHLPFGPRDIPTSIPFFGIEMKYIGQRATLRNRTPKRPAVS